MKFLVPNYSYRPQIPVLSILNWICWPPPRTNFLGTPLVASTLRWMVLTGINRNTPKIYASHIPHILASARVWAARQVSFKAILVLQPVRTVVWGHEESVPVRRRHYAYAGIITPSRALLQQQIFQYSVQHNYMTCMWELLHNSVSTDQHQAISRVFKNKVKSVIRMDSPFIIITAWDPTS